MLEERFNKNKILIIGSISALIIVIFVTILNSNNVVVTEPERMEERVGDRTSKFIVFYNLDILTMVYGLKGSTTIATEFENYVMSEEQMQFSGVNKPVEENAEVYYDATIDMAGFSSYTNYRYGFDVRISDGRIYKVITKTDSFDEGFTYIYSAILREGGDKIFVIVNGAENDKDAFVDFVKQKLGKDQVEVKVAALDELED